MVLGTWTICDLTLKLEEVILKIVFKLLDCALKISYLLTHEAKNLLFVICSGSNLTANKFDLNINIIKYCFK